MNPTTNTVIRASISLCSSLALFGCSNYASHGESKQEKLFQVERAKSSGNAEEVDSKSLPPAAGAAADKPADRTAGCILTGNLTTQGAFSSFGSTNQSFTNTKNFCARRCTDMISGLRSKTGLMSRTYGTGCSYSCKWDGADIVDRFESETSCRSGTADPF